MLACFSFTSTAVVALSTAREPTAVTSQGVGEQALCAKEDGPTSSSTSPPAAPETSARRVTRSSRTSAAAKSSISTLRGL
eukprot:552931-Prymnesium_polylepis.1